ncbi:MAG TPA: hypothetical protein VLI05_00185 [Candidatus Saccharimonadia bacterium]|nr:hypothetical protein [Candidatus Saccharimonadia bacterium]
MTQTVLLAEQAKLLEQHPCLKRVYDEVRLTASGAPVTLHLEVLPATAEALYWQPDQDRGPWREGERHSQRTQSLRPIHRDGRPGHARSWGGNGGNLRYIYKLFDQPLRDWGYAPTPNPDPFEVIGSIMLTTIDRWQQGLGPVECIDLTVTLLLVPEQGWRRLYSWARLTQNIKLDQALTSGGLHAITLRNELQRLALKFEADVWMQGLAELATPVAAQLSLKGRSAYTCGNVWMEVSAAYAGGFRVSLADDGNRHFALVYSASKVWLPECDSSATLPEIIEMVETVCGAWHVVA